MRFRPTLAITMTVFVYAAAALMWRQVYPFRDGLAEFLPEGTIAYVHVNLTPTIRRTLRSHLDSLPVIATTAPEKHGRVFLEQAINAYDVRELGFVWYQSDTSKPTDQKTTIVENWSSTGLESLAPRPGQLALIIGQRASARPDVVPATTVTVGGQEVRAFVVRVQEQGGLSSTVPRKTRSRNIGYTRFEPHRNPVQAMLWPRALPLPALDAARHVLPETMTASGILNRRGFVLRTDDKIPFIVRSTRTELLAEPRPGTFQIIGLPVRAIAEQLDLPFHGELRAAIEPLLPERADLLIEDGRVAVRMPVPTVPPSETIPRSLAARVWPVAERRPLDGLPAEILVADPDALEIVAIGLNRWVLRSRDDGVSKIFAEQSGDFVYLATDEVALKRIASSSRAEPRDPARSGVRFLAPLEMTKGCRLDDRSPLIVWSLHPQAVVTASVDWSGSNVAICGRIAQQEN